MGGFSPFAMSSKSHCCVKAPRPGHRLSIISGPAFLDAPCARNSISRYCTSGKIVARGAGALW